MTETDYQCLIGDEWVATGDVKQNINPSDTNDVIAHYHCADEVLTRQAVSTAAAAFPGWAQTTIQTRADCLERIGAEIMARKAELGELLAREEGKTLPEAVAEVGRAAQIFKFYSGEALRVSGELLASVRPEIDVEITREPLGVVGVISPWNFPIAIPAWKIAPALACGNTVVFKPAEVTPGMAWALAEIISRAGLPDGVFNMVIGAGSVVGQAIVNDPLVRGVSFTGSTFIGRKVAHACLERGAKFQLEMGGKNPLVVLADADLDIAVDCALNGAYFSTGQKCTASSRLIIENAVHDAFVDRLKKKVEGLNVGHALDEGTAIGPVVSESQLDVVLRYVDTGCENGADLVCGGERLERRTPGHYIAPALFADTKNGMRINQEEIFGPVASTIRAGDLDEAIELANDTVFGLSAGICTTSLSAAREFKRRIQSGMVMVNLPTAGVDYHVPFGGTKASSYGAREQGAYARDFYTTVKTAYIG